jgi:hypothetical protein
MSGRFLQSGKFLSWGTDGSLRLWDLNQDQAERVISVASYQPWSLGRWLFGARST